MTLTERQQVLQALRGQSVSVPNMHNIMSGWPQSVNLEVQSLRDDVDERLDQ